MDSNESLYIYNSYMLHNNKIGMHKMIWDTGSFAVGLNYHMM